MLLPAPGTYDLVVAGQAPWHRHALVVTAVDERADDVVVHGALVLDRAPLPRSDPAPTSEVRTSFVAARAGDASFAVVVVVDGALPRTLSFALQPIDADTVAGVVDVRRIGAPAPRRAAVVARRRLR